MVSECVPSGGSIDVAEISGEYHGEGLLLGGACRSEAVQAHLPLPPVAFPAPVTAGVSKV